MAELDAIEGENDFSIPSVIPLGWTDNHVLGTAVIDGNYADIFAGEWITLLRRKLASKCLSLGIKDFDASVLQSGSPRRVTQLASRVVYELSLPGIYYRSRYGHDFENWAVFEPFRITDMASWAIAKDNPALLQAARILELTVIC